MCLFALGLFLSSCEDEDKNNFDSFQSTGAFVRFETAFPSVVDVSTFAEIAGVSITFTLEDPNKTVVRYNMQVSGTVGGESFGPAPIGSEVTSFPSTVTVTMAEIASALGIDVATVNFGDTFSFAGTAENLNGLVYTSERQAYDSDTQAITGGNNTADIIDEDGYRNAFEFGFAIPCPQETGNFAGTWVLDMIDLYGDGWDGAFVTFEIDGAKTDYTIADGSAAVHNVVVPAGTQKLVVSYTSGAFEEEHVYTVTKPDGTELGPFGPEPPLCIN